MTDGVPPRATGATESDGNRLLPDWELWSCALSVERQFGSTAYAHVAERVGTLARAGDWKGVATWRAIAARLDRLHDDGRQH